MDTKKKRRAVKKEQEQNRKPKQPAIHTGDIWYDLTGVKVVVDKVCGKVISFHFSPDTRNMKALGKTEFLYTYTEGDLS